MELLLLHSEVVASVSYKLVVFDEGASVEKQFNALSSSQFVLFVVFVNSVLTTTEQSLCSDGVPSLNESLRRLCGRHSELRVNWFC